MTKLLQPARAALCAALLLAALPPQAEARNIARDALMRRVVALTDATAGWSCEGGQTCAKLSDAGIKFVERGADVFVQSNIAAQTQPDRLGYTYRQPVRLERAVILDVERDAFHLQVEYEANGAVYPIALACATSGWQTDVTCAATAAVPGSNDVYQPYSILKEEIRWRKK